MDHSQAPVLDALAAYHREEQLPFTPPGHKQGRGADPRVREVLGDAVFRSDVLAISGLDDRTSSNEVLERAQELMADAVHAERTFFSTCGSSLSVKSAMLAVAGPGEKLLVGRDAHKSVVSGLILSGVRPIWVEPQWDASRGLAHPPSPDAFAARLDEHPDARGALVTSPTPYGNVRGPRRDRRRLPRARQTPDRGRGVGARTCRSTPTSPRGRWTPAPTCA
jgi:arginine/lysine/ornithine decarboxylase